VGLRNALRLANATPSLPSPELSSPWSSGTLSSIVWSDVFGNLDTLPMTRAEALAIDSVARARDLLTAVIARCTLDALRGTDKIDPPTWTFRTDGDVPPYLRMLWTVDDLIFTGWSMWAVTLDASGHVLDGARVPRDRWEFDPIGRVLVDGEPVDADTVRLIAGPHEGILNRNSRALRSAAALDRAYLNTARNPTPDVELHQSGGVQMDRGEIADLLADWRTARQAEGGAVAYTPANIDVRTHGAAAESLLIAGRNAAAVSVGRIIGVPAALLDATSAGASLEYETVSGRSGQFLDYGVEAYMGPIEACLSSDSWVPRGTRIAFDRSPLTSITRADTGPTRQD
jgi:hypothetical protein